MVFYRSIDQDDFQGKCTGQKFGLTNTVKSILASNSGAKISSLPEKCSTATPGSTAETPTTKTVTSSTTTTTVKPTTTVAPTTSTSTTSRTV